MDKLSELKKYLGHEFSSGCETGEDYKAFERKYITYIKSLCKEYGWMFVKALKGHYEFSVFIKNEKEQYVYIHIPDVRDFKDRWFGNILIRSARNENDFQGGQNRYCGLPTLPVAIDCIFQGV